MIHPRPRTLWSRWVEGFEAMRLERRFEKAEILEFYLNQVPYARNRRGVRRRRASTSIATSTRSTPRRASRSRSWFEAPRVSTSRRARRPSNARPDSSRRGFMRKGVLSDSGARAHRDRAPSPSLPRSSGSTPRISSGRVPDDGAAAVATTLDGSLQRRAQRLLDRQIASLAERGVEDGAVLVVDHETDEILVWANAGGFTQEEGGQIDMVTVPRQPGSTLKPFALRARARARLDGRDGARGRAARGSGRDRTPQLPQLQPSLLWAHPPARGSRKLPERAGDQDRSVHGTSRASRAPEDGSAFRA